jgi:hypothetical protein
MRHCWLEALACVSVRWAKEYMRLVLQHLGPDQALMQYLSYSWAILGSTLTVNKP